jgi:hypothetical protein
MEYIEQASVRLAQSKPVASIRFHETKRTCAALRHAQSITTWQGAEVQEMEKLGLAVLCRRCGPMR